MKTWYIKIKRLLENNAKYRWRSNKDEGIIEILRMRYPKIHFLIEERKLSTEDLINIVQDYASLDRAWRKTLEENPELRGGDYEQKHKLELKKMVELGYNVREEATLI